MTSPPPVRAPHPPPPRRTPPVWVFVSAAWLGPILAGFETYMQARLGKWQDFSWRWVVWEGGDWLIYALLTPFVFMIARRVPLVRGHLARRVPVHFLASILLCGAWAGLGTLLRWALFPQQAQPTPASVVSWFFTSLPFGVAVYFAVLGVEHAAFFFPEARTRETQAARLSAQLAAARLGALRMQLQPHFLFNSLNAITVIVRDRDTATATRMLEQLGEMLRRVMRAGRPQEVPLAEELEFVRQYLSIEQIRFSDRLRPVIAVAPGLERAATPEFLLQPLVENAVRHGLAKRMTATLLKIDARREGDEMVLTITDDGRGRGMPRRPRSVARPRHAHAGPRLPRHPDAGARRPGGDPDARRRAHAGGRIRHRARRVRRAGVRSPGVGLPRQAARRSALPGDDRPGTGADADRPCRGAGDAPQRVARRRGRRVGRVPTAPGGPRAGGRIAVPTETGERLIDAAEVEWIAARDYRSRRGCGLRPSRVDGDPATALSWAP